VKHTFRNERGNDITLELFAGKLEDEVRFVLMGPASTLEATITEKEAYWLGNKLRDAWSSRNLYRRLIGPLRAKAKELGYALTVHGSLARDIDVVAVPWSGEAVPARQLAEALRDTIKENNNDVAFSNHDAARAEYFDAGMPGHKPHGRLVWTFHLGGGPYIDLSVAPMAPNEEPPDAPG
jgi:hypothetical protein